MCLIVCECVWSESLIACIWITSWDNLYLKVFNVFWIFLQVLKKADMIRKNAVESILAERNILISVRNPFVVRRSHNL